MNYNFNNMQYYSKLRLDKSESIRPISFTKFKKVKSKQVYVKLHYFEYIKEA